MSKFSLPELPQTTLIKIGVGILALAIAAGLFFAWLQGQRRDAVNDHVVEVEAKTTKAKETASEERIADIIRDTKNEEELHDAIDNAASTPGGNRLSDADRALNCKRLQNLGRIPAACRPENLGGAEASPR